MIAGDRCWTVFDILPAMPPMDAQPATFVGDAHDLRIVATENNPQPLALSEHYQLFDDEADAWAYVSRRLRQHADHVLERAEAAAAKAMQATVTRVGLQ